MSFADDLDMLGAESLGPYVPQPDNAEGLGPYVREPSPDLVLPRLPAPGELPPQPAYATEPASGASSLWTRLALLMSGALGAVALGAALYASRSASRAQWGVDELDGGLREIQARFGVAR